MITREAVIFTWAYHGTKQNPNLLLKGRVDTGQTTSHIDFEEFAILLLLYDLGAFTSLGFNFLISKMG